MRYLTPLTTAILICLLATRPLCAQGDSTRFLPNEAYKVLGFNGTPLLVQLIPFNRSDPRVVGPYYVNWRSYILKNEKLKGFKLSLGIDLSDSDQANPIQTFLNFRLGFEGYRRIGPRWGYTRGFNIFFSAGDLNTPGSKQTDEVFLGIGPHWGVDFFVSPKVSLSLETALVFGSTDFGTKFEFIPPVALNLNFWSPKRDRRTLSP